MPHADSCWSRGWKGLPVNSSTRPCTRRIMRAAYQRSRDPEPQKKPIIARCPTSSPKSRTSHKRSPATARSMWNSVPRSMPCSKPKPTSAACQSRSTYDGGYSLPQQLETVGATQRPAGVPRRNIKRALPKVSYNHHPSAVNDSSCQAPGRSQPPAELNSSLLQQVLSALPQSADPRGHPQSHRCARAVPDESTKAQLKR